VAHIGCIGFIIFSILGVTAAAAIFRSLLLNRYFFHILILISFVFATISALVYLKKNGILSFPGIKRKKGYLLTLYGTTIGVNLVLFMLIFPIMANIGSETSFIAALSNTFQKQKGVQIKEGESFLGVKVDIPCPGHAPLIVGELKKISGVKNVVYRFPNLFDISYYHKKTSKNQMLSLEVFDIYKATVIDEIYAENKVETSSPIKKAELFELDQIDIDDFERIPLSEITNEAKWYEYDLDGKTIKFFAVRAEDGSIKTAFDACDVCYYSGKGYSQEGDYMVCNNCGNKYPISGIGTENKISGGCWPGYLLHIAEGDNVLINVKDLADNTWRAL